MNINQDPARLFSLLAVAIGLLTLSPAYVSAQDTTLDAYAASYRYERAQNYSDAIRALMVIQNPDYLTNLRIGWLYYLNGNFANSQRYYQAAIADAPHAIEPRLGYMLPLLAQQRYAEVESVARQVLTRDSMNYYANLRLVIALRMQNKLAVAEEVVVEMLGLYPTDVSLLAQAGLIYAAQGNQMAARHSFRRVLTLDPENVTAKQQLGIRTASR